ncbi:MAG: ABC transporter permease [Chloroflexi bacterium]|nr:ABC transporter permease [Chloroflexota bacterium]MDL1883785.1 ABC transporter permease [Anaerolineae bacterium CFX8]
MDKLWSVAANDIRVTFKDRTIWLQLVIIPVVIMFFIGLANGGFGGDGVVKIRLDVFDQDNSALSGQLLGDLRAANEALILCPMDGGEDNACRLNGTTLTEELAAERVKNGTTQATIIIPAGFGEAALAGQPVSLIYRSQETPGQASPALGALQAVVQRVGGAAVAAQVAVQTTGSLAVEDEDGFKQAVYDDASALWNSLPPTVSFSESAAKEGRRPSGFSQSVPGIGTMYVMAATVVVMFVFIQERKQWTFQRILTMPVAPWQFVGGKLLARFINGMIQYGVAFAFGLIVGAYFGDSPLALVMVMVAFALCSTALGLLFATLVKTEQQAGSVINLVVLIAAPLGGAWWPLEIVPEWMRTVGHISPIAWAMDAFRSVIFYGGGVESVVTPVLVLLGMTAVLFIVAVSRLKYE